MTQTRDDLEVELAGLIDAPDLGQTIEVASPARIPEAREQGVRPVTTATVLGAGPIAAALAHTLPLTTIVSDGSAIESDHISPADAWIAVVDTRSTEGERCWLRATSIAATAARLAELRGAHGALAPRIVLVLVGGPADYAAPQPVGGAEVSGADLDELRVLARQPGAPWLYEAVGRRLVGGCDASLGGDITCRHDEHLSRAVAVAAALLPGAAWISAPEVLVPHTDGPVMSWARRGARGSAPTTPASTIDCVASAITDNFSQPTDFAAPSWRTIVMPAELASEFARARAEDERVLDDPRDEIAVVVPPRPIRPSRVIARQQECLWNGKVKHGNVWTSELTERLTQLLGVADDEQLLTVATGTAGLRMAFEQVLGRPARGDLAVLPAFTFPATAEALLQMGFRLRFVDVDPDTWNMDPDALDHALSDGQVALAVAVDALGAPCDHAKLRSVASRHGVPIVADSAAALGARHRGGPVAGWQRAHAYSLSFAKTMTAGGAGGAVVMPRDDDDGERAKNWPRSSMMTEIHAITALDQLDAIDDIVRRRQLVADAYDAILAQHDWVTRQKVRVGDQHSWVHYSIRLPDETLRDQVAAELTGLGIQTKPYYAPALHHPSWEHRFDSGDGPAEWGDLSVTTHVAARALALPMSSELSESQLSRVTEGLEIALAAVESAA